MQLRPISKLCVYALAVTALWANPNAIARANGRPPGTTGILAAPADPRAPEAPRTLVLGVTFGLAVSHDDGQHFRWVCEEAIGGPTGVDALMAAPSSQVLVTGSAKGLFISRDGGCDWQAVPLFASPKQVSALATSPAQANTWYVAVNVPEDNRGHIYVTHNGGTSFTRMPMHNEGAYVYGLAVAPTAPERLVAAASNNGSANSCLLLTSKNAGRSWQQRAVQGAPRASATPLVAVSPTDANVLVVSALDVATNGSEVLLSRDFGQSFRALGSVPEPVRNIVFGPKGEDVYVATTGHIHRAQVQEGILALLPVPKSNACLGLVGDALYACGSSANNQDGFALAKSMDGGATFAPLMSLSDIEGPTSCPAESTAQKICTALWPNQLTAIKAAATADPGAEFMASEQQQSTPEPTLSPTPPSHAPKAQGCRCDMGVGHGNNLEAAFGALMVAGAYMLRHRRSGRYKTR